MERMLMIKKTVPCHELPWVNFNDGIPLGVRLLIRQGKFYTFGIVEMPSIGEPGKYQPMFLFVHTEHDNKCHDVTLEDRYAWSYIDLREKTEYVFE
jgi:hypothetical protein